MITFLPKFCLTFNLRLKPQRLLGNALPGGQRVTRAIPQPLCAQVSTSTAAVPSSGAPMATHDYHQCRLGSTASNGSCKRAEYAGEAIPHHRGLPKADLVTGGQTSSGSPLSHSGLQCRSPLRVSSGSSGKITCDLVLEAVRKQPGGRSGKAKTGNQPS